MKVLANTDRTSCAARFRALLGSLNAWCHVVNAAEGDHHPTRPCVAKGHCGHWSHAQALEEAASFMRQMKVLYLEVSLARRRSGHCLLISSGPRKLSLVCRGALCFDASAGGPARRPFVHAGLHAPSLIRASANGICAIFRPSETRA